MQKIRIAVVGFGNVGHEVLASVLESRDMEVAGIVEVPEKIQKIRRSVRGFPVVSDVEELEEVHVAVLAVASRSVEIIAPKYLEKGINTVDAFDIHGDAILKLKNYLGPIAKANNSVAIVSAGWDPGTNSVVRVLMEAIAPKGITYTNYGPGISLGHTVAVKAIDGVEDAVSITVPKGNGKHERLVYVKIKEERDFEEVSNIIKQDPYFIRDHTYVFKVDDVEAIADMGHGVHIERKGVSGKTHNQRMEFIMSVTNPAATAQLMVSAARASMKQKPGCYTLLEIPPIDYLMGAKDENIFRLM
ncbi:MAG: diaminopimelate dehydrogenase [Tepidanaerobacteraceae bacterium]|jgi:diaminopimelate dehydrogenase